MRAITTASLLLACCVFFCSQTYAQQSSKEVGSQTGTRALVNGVRAWLVTKDGSVPVEETGVRYLTRNVDYSCTRKPLFEVVRDLKELAPVTVNRQALQVLWPHIECPGLDSRFQATGRCVSQSESSA